MRENRLGTESIDEQDTGEEINEWNMIDDLERLF